MSEPNSVRVEPGPLASGTQPALCCKRGEPAWEIAYLFPTQGNWTEQEYLTLDTNRLVEFSDGFVELLAMPTILHQMIVSFLHRRLDSFVQAHSLGIVLFAPLPVRLWPGKYREPDIVYAKPTRVRNLRGQPEGADLAVEVVSEGPESRERDHQIKRHEYALAGIPEYWVVDPVEQTITVLVLAGQSYRTHGVFRRGEQATSVLLSGFAVAVEDVFALGD